MTGTTSAIEWYLARDGQQHGPLSETEMRTFVDMGHLREQDLVWRSGFADWRSAPEVFAIQKPLAPNPAAPAAAPPLQPSAYQPLSDRLQSASRAPTFENERTPEQPAAAAPRDLAAGTPIAGHAEPRQTLLSPDQLAYTAETAKQSANVQAARPNFEQGTPDWSLPPLAASEDIASGQTHLGRGPDHSHTRAAGRDRSTGRLLCTRRHRINPSSATGLHQNARNRQILYAGYPFWVAKCPRTQDSRPGRMQSKALRAVLAALVFTTAISGCSVSAGDIDHWKRTVRGGSPVA